MTVRCLNPSSPTCRLPPIAPDVKSYTCPVCGRVWRAVDRGHGSYWQWDGRTRVKVATP